MRVLRHATIIAITLLARPLCADTTTFDILEYEVRGNSLLPQTVVESAVYPYLGKGRSVQDVEAARADLQKAFRDAGYATVVVDVPEQTVDSGVVQLQVVESKVSRVRVLGSRYYEQGRIRAETPSIAPGTTPSFTQFQNDLQTVNRFPGSKVTPILRPGVSAGTTEIDLVVEDKNPLSASLELNNHHSPNTSSTRMTGSVSYANLWQAQHNLSIQYQTAPEKPAEAKVWVVSYLVPISNSDKLLAMYAVRSRSAVAALSDFTVIGNGDIGGLRLVNPLPPLGELYHSVTFGLDYKDFQESLTQPGSPGVQTPIRYVTAGVSWAGSRAGAQGESQFGTGLVFGARGAGSDELVFDNKRFKSRGNFVVLKWEAQRTQAISKYMTLAAKLDGQFADQPLVANEQFSAGGATSVRGYRESERVGDNAAHATLELRGPSLLSGKANARLQPLAFAEGAYLWLNKPLPGEKSEFSLYSAGVGLRLADWHGLDASFDIAWPLKESTYSKIGETRAVLSTTLKF
jgi:hemolysin activation/secretion protein